MKPEALRDMSKDQLVDQLIALRKSHMDMRFQHASGQLQNIALLRQTKRDIARVKTEINRRALAADSARPASTETAHA